MFPSSDNEIIEKLETQKEYLEELTINSKDILNRIDSISKSQNIEIELLKKENKALLEKLNRLSISNTYPIFQERIEVLFKQYRYTDARKLLENFINENQFQDSENLSKLHYQISLTYFAERRFNESKKSIQNALSHNNVNYEILKQYDLILEKIAIDLNNRSNLNKKLKDGNIKNIISNELDLEEIIVSADKMNILYRGIDNPISISLHGFEKYDLELKGKGVYKKSKGKYTIRPHSSLKDKMQVIITGKKNGKQITSVREFRVLDIPKPKALIEGNINSKISKSRLLNPKVSIELPYFHLDLNLYVSSFKIQTPNGLVNVRDSKVEQSHKRKIQALKKGDLIQIIDIKAGIINSNLILKNVDPIILRISS
ncbi:hypothetical protein H2O64_21730 [Kordia sp. YSTF-M3]|uniref:Gliding motility-associated protein GldM C-terminal domain-containing protein n=1 Tax=Kordia aestuariivivens TaxID=2759037 RepID=A0ABR7QFF2_9FLAO|nr:GldM family protein [Kordia aestuariivivens]MBC8757305.1 hypothetical protein [Kordia aestuariivivens]